MKDPKLRLGFTAKNSALVGLLVLISTGVVGWWTYDRVNSALIERELANLVSLAQTQGQRFLSRIEELRRDVLYVSGAPAIQGIIRGRQGNGRDQVDSSSEEQWRKRLAHLFVEILRAKPQYFQVRYIGVANGGREIVRAVREDRQISIATLAPKSRAGASEQKTGVTVVHESEFTVPDFLPDDRRHIKEGDKSILVIEDDFKFASILMDLGRKKGYKRVTAGDGRTGLTLAAQIKPSAIILDIGLPDINGLNLLDYLKDNPDTRHIPVHVISAKDENIASLEKGAIGFLSKPASVEQLDAAFSRIESVLQSDIKQLLVVEDEPATQSAVVKLLENKQVNITMSGNGAEAFKALSTNRFDCMILDLKLPDLNGFELLKKLREDESIETPPIIVYTGKELSPAEHSELREYADTIVIKGASSPERLLDETSLFLHNVDSKLPTNQRKIIHMLHDSDKVLRNKKILLVDDDMRNTFALSKALRENGLQVVMADNGQFALEKLDNESDFDLIIMDIMMPVMDGYEAIKAIRVQDRYKTLPIIALTAKAMPEDRTKCLDAGASDYMTKPVIVEQLLSMLRVWLQK